MTPARRRVHIASELGALVIGVPLMAWVATQTPVLAARLALYGLMAATVLIDGGLVLHSLRTVPVGQWFKANGRIGGLTSSSSRRRRKARAFNLRRGEA